MIVGFALAFVLSSKDVALCKIPEPDTIFYGCKNANINQYQAFLGSFNISNSTDAEIAEATTGFLLSVPMSSQSPRIVGTAQEGDIVSFKKNNDSIALMQSYMIMDRGEVINLPELFGDSDCDDLSDQWELDNFMNLSNDGSGDNDGDGLLDGDEFERGTDPTDKDSDNDLMFDGWEVFYNLDPLDEDDALLDVDGDGFMSNKEHRFNTDPQDKAHSPNTVCDYDSDFDIDAADLGQFAAYLIMSSGFADLNADGEVNEKDIEMFGYVFGNEYQP
jgi:hypothetical protein